MALVKQLLTKSDFSGISVAPSAIVKPDPLPGSPGVTAAIGPGFDSGPYVGLSLPLTSQYQYNVNYWSVIQCGQDKASLWLNGWGYHLPKNTPASSLSGYHLAIGGGRAADLPTIWNASTSNYLQVNFEELVQTSYHENGALSQIYMSMFVYIPASGNNVARSMNITVPIWASTDIGVFNEGVYNDTNSDTVAGGVGTYASSPLRQTSRYITPWAGTIAFGTTGVNRLIGFNITRANMAALLADYCAKIGVSTAYYGNPDNWRFNGAVLQVETMWPDQYRPAGGGPLPGQCGVRFQCVEINVFN